MTAVVQINKMKPSTQHIIETSPFFKNKASVLVIDTKAGVVNWLKVVK